MPTLRQFEYLVAVSDLKHFGKAAASVNISQPTLSQQIRVLEERLGVKLVERNETPVSLTPIGREIASRAREIIVQVDDIASFSKRSQSGLSGTIRFGVTPTLGPYLMPPIVSELHKQYPDMRLHIREGIPDVQIDEIRRGQLDMMLSPLPVSHNGVQVEPLFRESLHIVAAPDHDLCAIDDLQISHLKGMGFLSLEKSHHLHRQTRNICDELGALLLEDYEGTSLDSLQQMAGSGLGLAILPKLYLESESSGSDMIKKLDIKGWSAYRSIAAIWRNGAAYSDSYQMISEMIKKRSSEIL